MPSKKDMSSSDDDEQEAPDLSNLREYSDIIMYFVRSGRFQYHSLLDQGRHAGVLSLLTAERVTHLTTERRLRAITMSMTSSGQKQKIYLIAVVRNEITTEELNDQVDRLNRHIEGNTSAEKEAMVIDLINNTSSRMRPGVRFAPLDWYGENEVAPAELLDEEGQVVDGEGKPIIPSEHEFEIYRPGKKFVRRDKRDMSLPRTTANLSDPETDSETSKKSKGTKRRSYPDWSKAQPSTSGTTPAKKKASSTKVKPEPDSTPESAGDHEAMDVPEGDKDDEEGDMDDERHERRRTNSDLNRSFQREMDTLRKGLGDLKSLVTDVILPLKQQLEEAKKQQKTQEKMTMHTRERTPIMYTDDESQLKTYFPINIYTPAMNWLLQRPIVQRFLRYEVIRVVYRSHPVFKPDAEFVIGKYIDYLLSKRLQSHFCKTTGRGRTQDYSRIPAPDVIVDIAQNELMTLAKKRVPGSKDIADFIKDKCNSARRRQLIGSKHILGLSSVQEIAHHILAERVDFVKKHEWLFKGHKVKKWTFDDEVEKTRKLTLAQKKPEDKNFDGDKPFPPHIETDIWPSMDAGQPLHDMAEAEALEQQLLGSGLNKPVFPAHVWDTIKAEVNPSKEDYEAAKKKATDKQESHKGRLERRREKRRQERAANEDQDVEDDDDDDDLEEDLPDDDPEQQDNVEMEHEAEETDAGPANNPSREELFGAISDISSNESRPPSKEKDNVLTNVNKDGQLVFSTQEDLGEETEDVPAKEGAFATTAIVASATASGLIEQQSTIEVATENTTTNTGNYSIVVSSEAGTSKVTGQSSATKTTTETLTKSPTPERQEPKVDQPKTAIQAYQDMDQEVLSLTVLEGKPHSSSESNGTDVDAEKAKPEDAAGPRVTFKVPFPPKENNNQLSAKARDMPKKQLGMTRRRAAMDDEEDDDFQPAKKTRVAMPPKAQSKKRNAKKPKKK